MHKNPFTCIISSHAMFICAYIIKYVGRQLYVCTFVVVYRRLFETRNASSDE